MEKETEILQQYIEDLQNIPAAMEGEKEKLISELRRGSSSAKTRLSELCLVRAMQIASEFRGQGLPLVDLIQESSMAVMMCLDAFDKEEERFDEYFSEYVRNHILTILEVENKEKKSEEELAEKINMLSDTTQALAERFGREATLREISEYTKLTEDEIRTLMKMSLDAL